MLLFNRCIVVFLFWWFYPHLRQGNTPGGHWFVRRSFFPVWGRCNFLILLLSTDLTAVLPQPSQVLAAHLTPHIASESFYLSCLCFCICTPGSFNIKIYNHIFLAHLNNGSGFYILSYREVLFIFCFWGECQLGCSLQCICPLVRFFYSFFLYKCLLCRVLLRGVGVLRGDLYYLGGRSCGAGSLGGAVFYVGFIYFLF